MITEEFRIKLWLTILPMLAGAIGAASGSYATIRVIEARVEMLERQVTLISPVATALAKVTGTLDERGPRIAALEVQVMQLNARIDRIVESDRRATRR